MNNFQSIDSGDGLLKINYDPMYQALKKRRDGLTDKIMVPTKDKLEGTDEEEKVIRNQNVR